MKSIHAILHPTDHSESAKPAFDVAVRLAHDHGARLILLHVAAPPVLYGEMGMTIPVPEIQKEILSAERNELEGLAADSGAECRVVEGAAAAAIVRHAREEPCDLIVMGTHGRGGVARLLLGSVTEAVLRQAHCPVLAIKSSSKLGREEADKGLGAAAQPLFPVILHPTDFSDRSRHAFELACTLARGGGRLIVLHVVEAVQVVSEGYEEALEGRLHGFQPDDASIRVEYRLREGDAAEEIISEAAASACDLIALGTDGRTGLDRLLMGSVAEAVLRHAGSAVLIMRAPCPSPSVGNPGPLAATIF